MQFLVWVLHETSNEIFKTFFFNLMYGRKLQTEQLYIVK